MKKIYALCLSALVAGNVSAGNAHKDILKLWKRNAFPAVSVAGLQKRNTTTMQLQAAGLAPRMFKAAPASDGPVSSVEAPGFGFLTGPDGTQWYYTQDLTVRSDGFYKQSVITVYDSSNKQVGQVTIDLADTDRVNQIEPFGSITKKMFDRDESTSEIMISMHQTGDASNGYQGSYLTNVYNLSGKQVASYNGIAVFFDASKDWNTYQRLLLSRGAKDEKGASLTAIDVIAPPGWGDTTTKVEHTFVIPDSLTAYLMGSPINCYVVDDKPYYVISHYAKSYTSGDDSDLSQDLVITPDNSAVIASYDKNFKLVDSLSIPIKVPEGALYRWAGFGMMSDKDMTSGYFTAKGERAYVQTWVDYTIATDADTYDFVLYDSKGKELKTICDNAIENQWWELSSINGFSDQMLFLQGDDQHQQIQMVDIPSCEKKTTIPATIDGEGITTTLDRYPAGDSYQYVIKMATADTDDDNNTIARIGWYTTDLKLDHMVKINLGPNGEYFTPLLNSTSLNPYLFNTDDKMEYIYIAKKKRTDGSEKIDNVLEIANEDGTVLKTFAGDDHYALRIPSVLAMTPTKNQLMVGLYNNDSQQYKLDFYDLPFTKFEKGGDGTAQNPYLVSTIGDMEQINANPAAAYKLAGDIDFSEYKKAWEPLESFTGTLDGDGHAISNLSVSTHDAHAGLFKVADMKSNIRNLNIVSPTLTVNADNQYAGIIAGETLTDTITNVHIYNASITSVDSTDKNIAPEIGGFAGKGNLMSIVRQSSFNGTIDVPTAASVGGIYGETMTSTGVAATAVSGAIRADKAVGGIIGSAGTDANIYNCHVNADLTANNTVGGIIGDNTGRGIVYYSYAEGTIKATTAPVWGGLAAGGIVGNLAANWSGPEDFNIVEGSVAAASIDADTSDGTVHRIVGYTIANEEDSDQKEQALGNNYAAASMTVGGKAVSSDDAKSVEGATKADADLNKEFLSTIGFSYGSDLKNPWTGEKGLPILYFENTARVLSLSTSSLSLAAGAEGSIIATVYGTSSDAIDCTTSDASVADVEISDADGQSVTLTVSAHKTGTTTITVTAGSLKAECVVTVGTTGISAATTTGSSLTMTQHEGSITAPGAASISVYGTDGSLKTAVRGERLGTTRLQKGVYVVVAAGKDGNSLAKKFVIK